MIDFKALLTAQAIVVVSMLGATGNAVAQNWENQSAMKVARVEATTVDYRGDIYVFNGFKPGIVIANSVEKYDAATKQWSIISSTSTHDGSAVTHNGVVRVGADVWIIGGRIGSHPGRVSDKVWVYNLNTGNWRQGPNLPTPGAAGGAALVNNKIHWFGGIDSNARCDVGNHFVYDLDAPTRGWNNITAQAGMPSPRNHFSTAVVDGIIYAMGGQYGHDGCPGKFTQDTPLVHAFNPNTNDWSRKADMPNKNSHSEPGTFVYKGEIYTTGGENAKNKVWKYNPSSNSWSTFRTLSDNLVAPIARIIDGHLIVAGGGGPIAQLSTNRVRSMLVDNNPPTVQRETAPVTVQLPIPGSETPQGATLISMEAEYFDVIAASSTNQWTHVALGQSSNDDAMTTEHDQGELAETTMDTPMLSYMVYFNHPGKHYIWIRGLGDTNDSGIGNNDSIQVGLNGTIASSAYRIDQFPARWTWSRHTPSNPVASLNVVNAGVNIVNFWMREDGIAIDKFVITSDPNFVPNGYGPELSDGTENFQPPMLDDVSVNLANDIPVDTNPVGDDAQADIDVAATNGNVLSDSNGESNYSALSGDNAHVNDSLLDGVNTEFSDSTEYTDEVLSDENAQSTDTLQGEDNVQFNHDSLQDTGLQTDGNEHSNDDTASKNTSSKKGLFGGSASMLSLFILFIVLVVRAKPNRAQVY